MRLNRRSFSFAGLALAMLAVVFAACTDDPTGPGAPLPPEPPVVAPPVTPDAAMSVECRYTVATNRVECGDPEPATGAARAAVLVGGQNDNVRLTSGPVTVTADTFAFSVTVQNLLDQPDSADGRKQTMGLDSLGVTGPIRVYFAEGPVVVGPSGGSMEVVNEDGMGTFTSGVEPYFEYNAQLDSGQTSGSKVWKLQFAPELRDFSFRLYIDTPVRLPVGWVNVEPDTIRLTPAATATLTGTAVGYAGKPQPGKTVSWSSQNTSVATVDASGVVTGGATAGTTIIRGSTVTPGQYGDAVVIVSGAPTAQQDTFHALTNVTVPVPAPGLRRKLTDPDGDARLLAGTFATANGGTVTIDEAGSFRYLAKPGFSGQDSFSYTVTDGVTTITPTAIVQVAASGLWFVRQGGTGAGTDAAPLGSLAAAQDSAGVGDTLLVLHHATPLEGAVVLENGQALIGQGIAAGIARTLNDTTFTVFAAGAQPQLTRASGATVTLAQNNTIHGLALTSGLGAAITGSGFGTLTVAQTSVNPRGPALDLTNGAIAGDGFLLLSSTDSDSAGLVLNNVTGTLLASSGTIANAAGSGVRITGGSVALTYVGAVNAAGPGVFVTGRTGGALAFSAKVAGAGVRVSGNGGGSVTFADSVVSVAAGGINAATTGARVVFAGPVRDTIDGITVTGTTADSVTFAGAVRAIRIAVSGNSGGAISFVGNAKTVQSGAAAAVALSSNTGATVHFGGGGLAITTTSGAGFTASGGGTVTVTGSNNTITTTTGTAATLDGVGTGAAGVTFATVNANGATNGIRLNALTGAGFQVTGTGAAGSGGTIAATTGHGIHMTALGATPVVLTNLAVSGAGAGGNAGISTNDVDNLSVNGVSVAAAGGPALSLEGTTLNGSFSNLTSTGSTTSALILNTVDGTATVVAGTLSGATGTTVAVIGGSFGLTFPGAVSQANAAPLLTVTNAHTGTLSFTGAVQATAGTGLQFNGANGTYDFGANTTLNGGDAGVDVTTGSTGTFTFAAGSSIANPTTGPALNVAASAPTLTFAGSITHNQGRAVAVDGLTGGTVTVSGPVSGAGASATGILVANATGGTVEFTGTKTLSTGANSAVTLTGNAAAANVRFAGGALAITTAAGVGFNADGAGTLAVTSTDGDNTVTTTGAPAVRILNTPIHGTSGVVFRSVSASGGANGIVLQNTTTGTFGVTGTGSAGSGGTIQNTTGAGVSLSSTAAAQLHGMNLAAGTGGAAAPAISGSAFGTLTVSEDSLTANTGPALLLTNGTLNGTFSRVSGTLPATAIKGVVLSGVAGSFAVTGGRLTGGIDSVMVVRGGTVSANWGGRLRQTWSASVPLLAVVGNHTSGTLTFSDSVVAISAGTGVQFDNADGTYGFTGNLGLQGADAGIDIVNGSSGTFTFGTSASVSSPSGTAFSVQGSSPSITYSGSLTKASTGLMIDVADQASGTISFATNNLSATNGDGVRLSNVDGTVNITASMSLAGGNAGVDIINGSSGTINIAPGAGASQNITNPTGTAVFISGGAPTVTMNQPISTNASRPFEIENLTGGSVTIGGSFTSTSNGIRVQGNSGGAIAFNGAEKTLNTGANAAVSLVSNTGASVSFGGGGLAITTTTGAGFSATGGGTVQVTGANNTAASTGGVAVNVQNTTISANGLSFRTVSATGGANGIVLQNTGTGGFQVTGNGSTTGSGGTIQSSTGADAAVAGNGVYLDNAQNVSLSYLNLSGHANHAIRGLNVTTFSMNRVRITGTNGTNVSGEGEGGVYFHGLFGSASITGSYIEGGVLDNVRVVNTSGTLDRLVMTSDTIGHNGNVGSDGVFLQADGSAVFKATVQNSRFTGSVGDQTQMSVRGTSNVDFVYSGNTLTNNHPARLPQNFGLAISSGGSGGYNPTLTYAVTNNSITDVGSTGISIGKGGVGAGTFTGSVTGNTVGTAGVANSGSAQGSAIVVDIVGGGSHTSTITNNTIRQFTNYGILAQSGNTTAGGGQGYLTLTIQGNNIAEPSPASASALFPTSGIRVVAGTNSGDTAKNCVTIGGTAAAQKNTLTGTGTNGGQDLRLFQRFTTQLGVPGYAGANNDNTAMNNFLTARNTLGAVSATNNVAAGGPGYSGSCPA